MLHEVGRWFWCLVTSETSEWYSSKMVDWSMQQIWSLARSSSPTILTWCRQSHQFSRRLNVASFGFATCARWEASFQHPETTGSWRPSHIKLSSSRDAFRYVLVVKVRRLSVFSLESIYHRRDVKRLNWTGVHIFHWHLIFIMLIFFVIRSCLGALLAAKPFRCEMKDNIQYPE